MCNVGHIAPRCKDTPKNGTQKQTFVKIIKPTLNALKNFAN